MGSVGSEFGSLLLGNAFVDLGASCSVIGDWPAEVPSVVSGGYLAEEAHEMEGGQAPTTQIQRHSDTIMIRIVDCTIWGDACEHSMREQTSDRAPPFLHLGTSGVCSH